RLLKENGYATCQSGKWLQVGETPKDWGFGQYCTDPTAGGCYWKRSYLKNGETITTDKGVYCPDVVHDFAIDFINRNKGRPFFLYYAPHLVHVPMERTPDSKPGARDVKQLYADNLAYLSSAGNGTSREVSASGGRPGSSHGSYAAAGKITGI